jgi:hypothetical protein
MSLLRPSKNEVAFKIIIKLVIDQMVILKATSILEEHKNDTKETSSIIRYFYRLPVIFKVETLFSHFNCLRSNGSRAVITDNPYLIANVNH